MKNTDCGCRYKGPIQILSCPEHNVAAKNLNVAQAMIARLENEIEALKAGRPAGHIWLITGGDYEPYEVVIQAPTADEAIAQYRAHNDVIHATYLEQHPGYAQVRRHSVVDVWAAEFNAFGIVEMTGDSPVLDNVTD